MYDDFCCETIFFPKLLAAFFHQDVNRQVCEIFSKWKRKVLFFPVET